MALVRYDTLANRLRLHLMEDRGRPKEAPTTTPVDRDSRVNPLWPNRREGRSSK
jgi:hypothetical protein